MGRARTERGYRDRATLILRLCFLLQMKGCIKVLKEQAPDSVEGLLNALR